MYPYCWGWLRLLHPAIPNRKRRGLLRRVNPVIHTPRHIPQIIQRKPAPLRILTAPLRSLTDRKPLAGVVRDVSGLSSDFALIDDEAFCCGSTVARFRLRGGSRRPDLARGRTQWCFGRLRLAGRESRGRRRRGEGGFGASP